jgi:large subunit ribosomal protein L23
MQKNNPYHIIKSRYVTEKSRVLEGLHKNNSNPSVRKCDTPKYTFIVDNRATKQEIARSVEAIYADKNIKVIGVNTITIHPKARTVRGRKGMKAGFRKAVVTLKPGHLIEDKV